MHVAAVQEKKVVPTQFQDTDQTWSSTLSVLLIHPSSFATDTSTSLFTSPQPFTPPHVKDHLKQSSSWSSSSSPKSNHTQTHTHKHITPHYVEPDSCWHGVPEVKLSFQFLSRTLELSICISTLDRWLARLDLSPFCIHILSVPQKSPFNLPHIELTLTLVGIVGIRFPIQINQIHLRSHHNKTMMVIWWLTKKHEKYIYATSSLWKYHIQQIPANPLYLSKKEAHACRTCSNSEGATFNTSILLSCICLSTTNFK